MKKLLFICLMVISLMMVCCVNNQDMLRLRGQSWMALLLSLPSGDEAQDIQAINKYLEPTSGAEIKATEYYDTWTKADDFRLVKSSIADVIISEDKKHGVIRYSHVYETPTGQKSVSQLTNWIRREGTWYRVID